MSEEEKNKQFKEDLLNVTGNFLKTGLDCIEKQKNELEQLQQENQNLKQINEEHRKLNGELIEENKKLKEKLQNNSKINIADHKYASEMEDKYLELKQENKELKKTNASLQSALSLSRQKYKGDKTKYRKRYYRKRYRKEHNILTEFEKWLEKYKKDEMFDYGNEQLNNYFNEFCDMALDKLQELKKEGKNEKSND